MARMKRQFKLWISLFVRACDTVHETFCHLLGRSVPARCVVVYYHTVPSDLRELFARQMDVLLKWARPISTSLPPPLEPGQRYVCVTFDDGFLSVKENAAPELSRRRIPWTIFVPSGYLGKKPEWLRHAHPAARHDRVMTPEELLDLSKDPLVTIGSHTVVHANLLEVGLERAKVELSCSRADLESVLSKPVDQFSYPFGARNTDLDEQAKGSGYRRIFSSDGALAFQTATQFVCGRVSVDPDMSLLEFRLKILGSYRWQSLLRRARA
jgi:peptidoglycan/xylan/chitin deacetylase (PgdA/CDA1 family)